MNIWGFTYKYKLGVLATYTKLRGNISLKEIKITLELGKLKSKNNTKRENLKLSAPSILNKKRKL